MVRHDVALLAVWDSQNLVVTKPDILMSVSYEACFTGVPGVGMKPSNKVPNPAQAGGVKLVRQTPSGKPHPGKGKGSNDMVRLIKCLQRRH